MNKNNLIHSFSHPFMQGLGVGFHSLRAGLVAGYYWGSSLPYLEP